MQIPHLEFVFIRFFLDSDWSYVAKDEIHYPYYGSGFSNSVLPFKAQQANISKYLLLVEETLVMFQSKILTTQWISAKQPSDKLMVVLHGRGDSIEGFLWLPNALNLGKLNYLLVNAPDDYYMGYSWYDLAPNQEPGVLRSRNLLTNLFAELAEAGFDSKNIILFGFSQGCLMTLEWGTRTDLNLAAYIGISGYCFDAESVKQEASPTGRKAPFLITHGYEDSVLDFKTTESQIQFLKNSGFNIDWQPYHKDHTIDPYEELDQIRAFTKASLHLE